MLCLAGKILGVRAFADSLPRDDLVMVLDADVIARPGLSFDEVRRTATALLKASRADFVMGAELGRFVLYMTQPWSFDVPDWARRRCPEHLSLMRTLPNCASRFGPCSKPPEPKYPNSGLLLGRAAMMSNVTWWVTRTYPPSKLRADDQSRYFKYGCAEDEAAREHEHAHVHPSHARSACTRAGTL